MQISDVKKGMLVRASGDWGILTVRVLSAYGMNTGCFVGRVVESTNGIQKVNEVHGNFPASYFEQIAESNLMTNSASANEGRWVREDSNNPYDSQPKNEGITTARVKPRLINVPSLLYIPEPLTNDIILDSDGK